MSGKILIVDTVATNRIVLRVNLIASRHEVRLCASLEQARAALNGALPNLIICDTANGEASAFAFFRSVKSSPATSHIPIIATGQFDTPQARVAALEAGADDLLAKPLSDDVLQARIRSLLRAQDAQSELRLRDDTKRALGFAEVHQAFVTTSEVTVVTARTDAAQMDCAKLVTGQGRHCNRIAPQQLLTCLNLNPLPDMFVIDATNTAETALGMDKPQIYKLVSELRSRSETRHAALLVRFPECADDVAAMVLDLGANDIVPATAHPREVAHRINALLKHKHQQDRLRDTVRSGLQAAVTDQLTGLFNRRYALPHLKRMADRAAATGRDFAVMVLDIDHFKAINDTHGHAVGDDVLVKVANRLRNNLRAIDMIARIGGEEFLIAMPDTSKSEARDAAKRLCALIQSNPFQSTTNDKAIPVTLSIGVALGHGGRLTDNGTNEIMGRADAALFDAKTSGRNTIAMSPA